MPKLSEIRLTPSLVRSAPEGDHPDSEVRGLTLQVRPSSRRYSLRYRPGPGLPQKRIALGDATILTLDEARALARAHLAARDKGEDPAAAKSARRAVPTVEEVTSRWLADIAVKPATRTHYQHHSRRWLAAWGSRKITDVRRPDVRDLYRSLEGATATKNQTIKALRAMMAWAIGEEYLEVNPTSEVSLEAARVHERFLDEGEAARFREVLAAEETQGTTSQGVIDVIRLCYLTGCRKSEILALTWSEVDLDRRCLTLAETKTGRSFRPLSGEACEVLRSIQARRTLSPLVCLSKRGGKVGSVDGQWAKLRGRMGLADVRLHDLRHSLASDGAAAGLSLLEIGAQLGHASVSSTARYAHLCQEVATEAADKIAARRASKSSNVIDLPKRKPA